LVKETGKLVVIRHSAEPVSLAADLHEDDLDVQIDLELLQPVVATGGCRELGERVRTQN
jgi:hypothetical protein